MPGDFSDCWNFQDPCPKEGLLLARLSSDTTRLVLEQPPNCCRLLQLQGGQG